MEIIYFIIGAYLLYILFIYGTALLLTILQALIKYWYLLLLISTILWVSL